MGYVPKRKMHVGSRLYTGGGLYDVYITPRGKTWLYSGTQFKHFKSRKFWKKASELK